MLVSNFEISASICSYSVHLSCDHLHWGLFCFCFVSFFFHFTFWTSVNHMSFTITLYFINQLLLNRELHHATMMHQTPSFSSIYLQCVAMGLMQQLIHWKTMFWHTNSVADRQNTLCKANNWVHFKHLLPSAMFPTLNQKWSILLKIKVFIVLNRTGWYITSLFLTVRNFWQCWV